MCLPTEFFDLGRVGWEGRMPLIRDFIDRDAHGTAPQDVQQILVPAGLATGGTTEPPILPRKERLPDRVGLVKRADKSQIALVTPTLPCNDEVIQSYHNLPSREGSLC